MKTDEQVLDMFGDAVISTRDEVFDHIEDSISEISMNRNGIRSWINSSENKEEIALEVSKYLVDRFIIQLMYTFEDLEVNFESNLFLKHRGKLYDLSEISDGLAGEFLTSEGWFSKKSKYCKSNLSDC